MTGGAGEVANLLTSAQQSLEVDARLVSLIPSNLRNGPFTQPRLTMAAALDEFLVSNHSSPTMLSLYRSKISTLHDGDIRQNSIVHLHWLSGVLTHKKIRKLLDQGRKVVWTLHDMAPFTGVCHHAHGCEGFINQCSDCPQVRQAFRGPVEINLAKKLFERPEKNLVLVAPTPWLAAQAQKGAVFKNQKIQVIENPIRPGFFLSDNRVSRKDYSQTQNGTGDRLFFLTAVASDLENPAKGIRDLVNITKALRGTGELVHLHLIGHRGKSFHDPVNGITWLGNLGESELVQVAKKTDLLVSASRAESAGLVVREFGAAEVPTVALRSGGISDLIEHDKSGLLVETLLEMSTQISALSNNRERCESYGKRASELAKRNKSRVVAAQYLRAYGEY